MSRHINNTVRYRAIFAYVQCAAQHAYSTSRCLQKAWSTMPLHTVQYTPFPSLLSALCKQCAALHSTNTKGMRTDAQRLCRENKGPSLRFVLRSLSDHRSNGRRQVHLQASKTFSDTQGNRQGIDHSTNPKYANGHSTLLEACCSP